MEDVGADWGDGGDNGTEEGVENFVLLDHVEVRGLAQQSRCLRVQFGRVMSTAL